MARGALTEIGRGRIIEIRGADTPARRRMIEMGATPGAYAEVVRAAPGRDPVQVALRGYALTLRRADAENIIVEGERGEGAQ